MLNSPALDSRGSAVWLWIWAQRQKAAYSRVDFNSSRLWCFCGVHGAKTTQRHNIYSSLHFHKHTETSARRMKSSANASEICTFLPCYRLPSPWYFSIWKLTTLWRLRVVWNGSKGSTEWAGPRSDVVLRRRRAFYFIATVMPGAQIYRWPLIKL